MVIFVHELGHFAVAKMCGVKCEKFYLGFDIGGLKLCKFRIGETEYGIGVLPLGGYVKMLGQEDNPARLREEIERAKTKENEEAAQVESDEAKEAKETEAADKKTEEEPIDVAAAEAALYDPRSYLAKSVPKRMAIISAGVIMNLIFAFLMAVVAFEMGVPRHPCKVGQLVPGEVAWKAGFGVGDLIVEIAGRPIYKFRDMQEAVSLGDNLEKGLSIVIRRPGVEQPIEYTVMPDSSGLLPRIGIVSPSTTTLSTRGLVAMPGSPAAKAQPAFEPGDKTVKLESVPIDSHAELRAYQAAHPDKPLAVTVQRSKGEPAPGSGKDAAVEELTIEVAPNPMRRLGLVMEMGPITAVQAGSPAEAAGIKPQDRICQIDGQPPGDPMTLPEKLRKSAGDTVTLTIERKGEEKELNIEVTLRDPMGYETPLFEGNPMTAPALGIAYDVLNTVRSTADGGPAAKAGLLPGDEIVEAVVLPPKEDDESDSDVEQKKLELKFSKENRNWPFMIYTLQQGLPGTKVELRWVRGEEKLTATLDPVASDDWFNPDRGFYFEADFFIQQGETLGDSIGLAADETLHATLLVYRFLQKLSTQQISPKALGGPVAIFTVAKMAAEKGPSELLIFLTLLSANLAVINFLPIPLLDGGHMVLLAWEGIRGKPADERVQIVLTYIGLVFILGLMAWVLCLDFGLIQRF